MKETVFNALPIYSTLSQVATASVGTYYLWDRPTINPPDTYGESAQQNNTALRHKITYHQRVASDGSLAGQGSLTSRRIFDILESDDSAAQSKTSTRPGLTRAATRDDDDRLRYNEPDDWS